MFRNHTKWFIGLAPPLLFVVLHVFFDIPGRFFFDKRGWDIPTDPQQKAAYDYAHSLKLPDSVPKPQPFDFPLARLKALIPGQPDVSTQYFNHLCGTESGEYIFKTVENVEGVFQMRPRIKIYGTPIDYDRYAVEEPTGIGAGDSYSAFSLINQGSLAQWDTAKEFIQPLYGTYIFLEQPALDEQGKFYRFNRGFNSSPPNGAQNGIQSAYKNGPQFNMPFLVAKEDDNRIHAHYGFTWRGIKHTHDRRHSIGGGEYLIVDLSTNEVLAVKREFKQSGYDLNTNSRIWWGNARSCGNHHWNYRNFVKKVLRGRNNLDEPYLLQYLPTQLRYLLRETN